MAGIDPAAARDDNPPRLVVELLELNNFQDDDLLYEQARAINSEFRALKEVLSPHVYVDWVRSPSLGIDGDYLLFDPVLKTQGDAFSLTASYRGPGAFEGRPTARYREPCDAADEVEGRCTKRTLEERAAILVADLLNQSLVHWRNGILRPFAVQSCKSQSLRLVWLILSPPSVVPSYSEPASWFEYRASMMPLAPDEPYPDRLELVLGQLPREGEAFVFELRYDPLESWEALCDQEHDEVRWILEHQYPGSYRYRLPVPKTLPGINAAPMSGSEEP